MLVQSDNVLYCFCCRPRKKKADDKLGIKRRVKRQKKLDDDPDTEETDTATEVCRMKPPNNCTYCYKLIEHSASIHHNKYLDYMSLFYFFLS